MKLPHTQPIYLRELQSHPAKRVYLANLRESQLYRNTPRQLDRKSRLLYQRHSQG
jgi:hypothetical protein